MSRRYRNRRIGEFLKELELTEGRSTGIPKMLRTMAENGSPAPEFETDDERSAYWVRLPARNRKTAEFKGENEPVPQLSTQLSTQLDDPVSQVLLLLQKGPLSPKNLRLKLEMSHRPTFRDNYLHPAIEKGWIEPTLPDKPTSRNQKYRLTEEGQRLLKESKPC